MSGSVPCLNAMRSGNGVGDHLRVGAGVARRHLHRGRRDGGVFAQRQLPEGDGAGQQHEQGQDDGEDRPRDEEVRELHWRASEAAACCMGTTRGVTAMPGRTRPLMTIRSPPCKPVLMTRSPSSIWPSSTARYWARLSLPTTST
ncbi:hypothetical protein G6F59_015875 [Rhizopus arrhizus]|nr:hypothetical protein G6F59_015875 [Rhizopus arrhizus]